ncbi:unnamed protein product [Larinioides sclopetarius]|uniref:Beta-ketoacyl synthase-like N-terminal domain-containing protein n=1 Tax=Larinioides sclopetarius TaxID=280406 RepID=A0AAV2AH87_9ARAC
MDISSDHHEYCTGVFDPDDIVISGITSRFPECDNVEELKEALYSKKYLVVFSPKRFEKDHHEYCTGVFDPDDIVISGITSRFPECDNVEELKEALYSKKYLVVFSPKRFEKDDIVISGITSRFPECDNVEELKEALYSKKYLVVFSPKRFEKGMGNVPSDSCALLKNLDKFDAGFFLISTLLANNTDTGGRFHLEIIYEALADAGLNPTSNEPGETFVTQL